MAKYDGSINIDTKIDTKGFDEGVDSMESSSKDLFDNMHEELFGGIKKDLDRVGASSTTAFAKMTLGAKIARVAVIAVQVALIGVAVVLAAAIAVALLAVSALIGIVTKSVTAFIGLDGSVQDLKDSFQDMKNALAIAFAPLVTFAIPYIQAVISWLIKMFNTIAMIVGALLGQKQVWQAVEGGAAKAAAATEKQAKSAAKLKKEAQGALAAFDQINVLQQPVEPVEPGGGIGAVGGALQTAAFEMVPISQELLDKLDAFKQKFAGLVELWEDIKAGNWGKIFDDLWKGIQEAAGRAWSWVESLPVGLQILVIVLGSFATAILLVAAAMAAWWLITGLATIATAAFGAVMAVITSPVFLVILAIGALIAIIALCIIYWKDIKQWAINVWNSIVATWKAAGAWFKTNVTDPIKNGFSIALDAIKRVWETTFTGIKTFVKNTINSIIDFVNSMIRAVVGGINSTIRALNSIKVTIPSWIPGFGGSKFSLNIPTVSAPQIPRLATGAVIPPNAAFAAILGDQRSGRNIEAPESLIRQIVREETQGSGGDITIRFEGTLAQFVRELKPYVDKENMRIGSSLIKGASIS
ncbi:MAG: hypothetical protein ABIK07_09000 [Planctomycetota bacterium]